MTATRSWVLADDEADVWVESFEVGGKDLGVAGLESASVRKRVLRGGLRDGVEVVEVDNGAFSFSVLPTRGMGLWRAAYGGHRIGWRSPARGPVHPKFVNRSERGGLGWLAGFDECVVRCGLESNGAPGVDVVPSNTGAAIRIDLGLHGRIANLPAQYVEIQAQEGDPPRLCVTGVVDEAMLFGTELRLVTCFCTEAGSNAVRITDEIIQMGGTTAEMQILYHCNFGPPFLGPGARLVVPASRTAPRDARAAEGIADWSLYQPPMAGFTEQCYWHVPLGDASGKTLALLRNAAGDKGVAVRFDVNQLPCFTQWKCTGAESDGYVTGLEPGTNYPNPRVFERAQGRVVKLDPGAVHRAELVLEAHADAAGVAGAEREIEAIQGDRPRTVHPEPQPDLSAPPAE